MRVRQKGKKVLLQNRSQMDKKVELGAATLSECFGKLFETRECCDVVFVIQQTKIPAHRIILAARSPVMKSLLFGGMKEASSEEVQINDSSVDAECFLQMMKWMYTDQVEITPTNVLQLTYLSKMYALPQLHKDCVKKTIEYVNVESVLKVWDAAVLLGEHDIAKSCVEFVQKNTSPILAQKESIDVSLDLVLSLVDQRHLQIDEIQLFQFVQQWIAKNKPNQSNISKIISYIQIHFISSDNLMKIVRPSQLVPLEVYADALEYQLNPTLYLQLGKNPPQKRSLASKNFTISRHNKRASTGWGYGGQPDTLGISVNIRCVLNSVQLFSGNGENKAEVMVKYKGKVLASKTIVKIQSPIVFDTPVLLEPKELYEIYAVIGGANTDYGKECLATVTSGELTVTFSNTGGPNGTDTKSGQFESFSFSQVC